MPTTIADDPRHPRPAWCAARGLALIALWLALVAGFVAQTTLPPPAPGETRTAAERVAGEPAS